MDMRTISLDNSPMLRGKVLGVYPWTDERSENLNRITISEVRSHINELNFKEVFEVLVKLIIQIKKTLLAAPGETKTFTSGNFVSCSSNSIKDIGARLLNLVNQEGIRPTHPRAIYEISAVPENKSSTVSPSSSSRKIYSSLKSNGDGNSYPTGWFGDRLLSDIFQQDPAIQNNIIIGQTDPRLQIGNATHHEEIFDILDLTGHQKIAKRLRYLHETAKDDSDDPDMKLVSLRKLALFFIGDDVSLPDPRIGISHDGFLQAEWYSSDAAALMNFMPDGNIIFAATSTIDGQNRSQDIHGTGEKELVLHAIRPFINQL